MSHILLKKVQDNLISAPASNYVKFFSNDSDGGLLYYMNNSGVATPVGSGSSNPVIDTTYSNLYSLYSSDGFATGSYYYINDFQSIYDQPDFYFDGTPKSSLDIKTASSYPVVVLATSKNTLAVDAYQPDLPKDSIKYDITWNTTELGNNAKGRITERIDTDGNRTDYDHKTVLYKRYYEYEKDTSLTGTITDWNCITGTVSGSGTSFTTEVSIGDVILLDTTQPSGGDLDYTIGLKVKTVVDNTTITVEVDSLYTGGVPSSVTLSNSTSINPLDYSFTSKNYTFWMSTQTGNYSSYKEFYFGQYDANDYDEVFTFISGGTSVNNYIGNYSSRYLSTYYNNTLILSNIAFTDSYSSYNKIGDSSYNNHFYGFASNNTISGSFYNNTILGDATDNNIIGGRVYNNIFGNMNDNLISAQFNGNIIDTTQTFKSNSIRIDFSMSISDYDLTSATHIYGTYNCDLFSNSNGDIKLSYYNGSNALTVVDIDA